MTGMYRFKTGFYGPTHMPAEFQNVMDYTFISQKNNFRFLGDLLIVNKSSEEDLFKLVTDCLRKIDAANLCLNLPKCNSTKQATSS